MKNANGCIRKLMESDIILESSFIYEVTGCTEEEMHKINAIGSEMEMFSYIRAHDDLDLQFDRCRYEHLEDNLSYIDLQMHQAVQTAVLVQIRYLGEAKSSMMRDIVSEVVKLNPIQGVRNPELWYEAKFKELLFCSISGMTATRPWDGRRRMTGRYFPALSDDGFMSYLYDHTLFDCSLRGVEKDKKSWGYAYKEGGKYYIAADFQIILQ